MSPKPVLEMTSKEQKLTRLAIYTWGYDNKQRSDGCNIACTTRQQRTSGIHCDEGSFKKQWLGQDSKSKAKKAVGSAEGITGTQANDGREVGQGWI